MKKLTYKEAYDKIIEAYFKDEIEPMDMKFCFCGTLAVGVKSNKRGTEYWDDERYSLKEYKKMETALMKGLGATSISGGWLCGSDEPEKPDYEERLFKGMCAALEVLKQIHKERGEDVDGVQEFKKRELVK